MEIDKKKLRTDIILVGSLLLVAAISLVVVFSTRRKDNLYARIYVQNEVVETVDLSKKEDSHFYIEGAHGTLHIHQHDGKIAVLESNCPHQDCVKMGYVSDSSHPIICAYNAVSIVIDGTNPNDVEIGG